MFVNSDYADVNCMPAAAQLESRRRHVQVAVVNDSHTRTAKRAKTLGIL